MYADPPIIDYSTCTIRCILICTLVLRISKSITVLQPPISASRGRLRCSNCTAWLRQPPHVLRLLRQQIKSSSGSGVKKNVSLSSEVPCFDTQIDHFLKHSVKQCHNHAVTVHDPHKSVVAYPSIP